MRFAVLGQLRVGDGLGQMAPMTSVRQRLLLATLLCRPGRPVPLDTLVEAVWTSDPPSSAVQNLQTYVHRLRRTIGHERVEFVSAGYRLVAEPHEVDAGRFEQLADRGRSALSQSEYAAAATAFTEALELWQAEPYADVERPDGERPEAVALESGRLSEARLGVLEDLADARLALSDHAALVSNLKQLCAEFPLRERLRGQLMLALYRSERAAEALETYREARKTFVEELGIEPSPVLQEREIAILNSDPALNAPPAPGPRSGEGNTPSTSTPVPAELPTLCHGFVGRSGEVSQLIERLTSETDRPSAVAISGPGGVGKSALTLRTATQVAREFPDGQLYVNLHGATPGTTPLEPTHVLRRFLRSFGLAEADIPTEADEAAGRFRSLTADRQVLVVLDDAVDVAQVRSLLPASNGSAVLLTSRRPLAELGGVDQQLRLDTLPTTDAIDLLAELAGAARVAEEPEAARQIAELCDYLPLALRIAAARLAARPDWKLIAMVERLEENQTRLDELAHGDLAVAASIGVSHQALPAGPAKLLPLLGVLDLDHYTPPVIAALIGRSIADVRRDLDQLVDSHLLRVDDDSHTMHDLVRLYVRRQAEETLSPADREAAIYRGCLHYLATVRHVAQPMTRHTRRRLTAGIKELPRVGEEFSTTSAASAWLRTEADHLAVVAKHALAVRGGGPAVLGLAAAANPGLRWQGLTAAALRLNQVALESVDALGGTPDDWQIHVDTSAALLEFGRYDEAERYGREAVAAAETYPDRSASGAALNNLAIIFRRRGRLESAYDCLERALEANRESGHRRGEAATLNLMAIVCRLQERNDEAVGCWKQSLALDTELGEHTWAGTTLRNLGQYYLQTGEPTLAVSYLDRSLESHRLAGVTRGEATVRWLLAQALDQGDQHDVACAHREQALALYVSMGMLTDHQAATVQASAQPELPERLLQTYF